MPASRVVLSLLVAIALVAAVACGSDSDEADDEGATMPDAQPVQLSSDAFAAGGEIPPRFTCDGEDVSPRLFWTAVGDGREFALIVDDPDANGFVHWVVYGIPITARELPEGAAAVEPRRFGTNDFGRIGYGGPCPPPGAPHQYDFTLYSLSEPVDLPPGATAAQLRDAIAGTVLAEGRYSGFYGR
jgi:Raf kinase inhibitor-like YbhB/YbcL family protein